MKNVKILALLLVLINSITIIHSGPCLRLGQELSRRHSQKSSGKIDAFKQPLSGHFTSLPKISRATRPTSYTAFKKYFNNPSEATITKLKKQYKQLRDDLDKIELLLLNFELNQKQKAIDQRLLEKIKKEKLYKEKLEHPEKEDVEIVTSKISLPKKIEDFEKESQLK